MKKHYSIFLLAIFIIFATSACSKTDKSPVEEAQQISQSKSASGIEKVEKKKVIKLNQAAATTRANTHLALKQIRWGDATKITEDENYFYLSYETPKREMRILGQRSLEVDKVSGLVKLRKRR